MEQLKAGKVYCGSWVRGYSPLWLGQHVGWIALTTGRGSVVPLVYSLAQQEAESSDLEQIVDDTFKPCPW